MGKYRDYGEMSNPSDCYSSQKVTTIIKNDAVSNQLTNYGDD